MDIRLEMRNDPNAPCLSVLFHKRSQLLSLKCSPQGQFEVSDVDVLDEEMKALHKLIQHKDRRYDDRRFAIEVQFDTDVELTKRQLLLAIFPETYLSDQTYVDKIAATGCQILTYPVYPLRKEYFYYAIYEKLDHFSNE